MTLMARMDGPPASAAAAGEAEDVEGQMLCGERGEGGVVDDAWQKHPRLRLQLIVFCGTIDIVGPSSFNAIVSRITSLVLQSFN